MKILRFSRFLPEKADFYRLFSIFCFSKVGTADTFANQQQKTTNQTENQPYIKPKILVLSTFELKISMTASS
jgi:hypothetical protein